jgi:branched-chain amino acid transport system substrate-binding protein
VGRRPAGLRFAGCPARLPKRSQLVFSAADHVLPPLGDKMPDGTIIGARGAYGLMSQKSPLNDWFLGLRGGQRRLSGAGAYRMRSRSSG